MYSMVLLSAQLTKQNWQTGGKKSLCITCGLLSGPQRNLDGGPTRKALALSQLARGQNSSARDLERQPRPGIVLVRRPAETGGGVASALAAAAAAAAAAARALQ